MTTEGIDWLYHSLAKRETPEAVAARAVEVLGAAAPGMARRIAHSGTKRRFGWSSMSNRFRGADPMDRQIAKARELALAFLDKQLPAADDIAELDAFIDRFNALIGKARHENSFRFARLDRKTRAEWGLTLSRRRYDKLFRLAARLEDRLARYKRSLQTHELVLISKSGLVADLKREDFDGKPWTASLVAYLSARMKLRSEFTIGGQQRPFDTLAARLLDGCSRHEDANWFAIAHVFPREDVLARLTDAQKGALLARSYGVLTRTAEKLQQAHERSAIDLETMIVRRGNDSSTWNTFAGAWNRARESWIALVIAVGMTRMFDALLPGKVMRLMAADVAAWHRLSGGRVHPDTMVWRDLPKPWLVLAGKAVCTKAMIDAACARHGVDPIKSGWSAARARAAIAEFRPTPELVHGVSVENPYLAHFLRRLGAFSGKELKLHQIQEILDPA
jgi:hypothetical protein